MAKDKKSFVLYSDQKELIEALSDEQAGKLIKHIYKYVNDENPKLEDPILNIAFVPIKQQLKRDLQKWEDQRKQRSEAGKKSAKSRKRKSTSVNERQRASTVNVNDNVNVNVNDNVNDNVNNKKEKKGVPPSFESFLNHAREKAKDKNIILDEEKVRTKFDSWLENDWCDLKGNKILNWKVKITANITYWQGSKKPETDNNGFQKLVF